MRYLLADDQLLADDGLAGRLCRMDVENEIGALKSQFIVKIDNELDADHLFPDSDERLVSGNPVHSGKQ